MKRTITYNGFGFPVTLKDWPHIKVDGTWEPDINYQGTEALLFNKMPFKQTELTGAELKFIRHHLEKTHEQFAEWLGITAEECVVYEATDLKRSKMRAKELILRWKLMAYEDPFEKDIDITVRLKAAPLWEMLCFKRGRKPELGVGSKNTEFRLNDFTTTSIGTWKRVSKKTSLGTDRLKIAIGLVGVLCANLGSRVGTHAEGG